MVYYRSLLQDERRVRKERRESKLNSHSAILAASAFRFADQYSIISSSGKQYSQRSPGSADATTG